MILFSLMFDEAKQLMLKMLKFVLKLLIGECQFDRRIQAFSLVCVLVSLATMLYLAKDPEQVYRVLSQVSSVFLMILPPERMETHACEPTPQGELS